MCFPLAQGCRKGGPNTKWFGNKNDIEQLSFDVASQKLHKKMKTISKKRRGISLDTAHLAMAVWTLIQASEGRSQGS